MTNKPRTWQPGAVIRIRDRAYRIETVTECLDTSRIPDSWRPYDRRGAVIADLVALDRDQGNYTAVLPGRSSYRTVGVLAGADDEGHYPACGHCGQPWPCGTVSTIREARTFVELTERRLAYETDHPWPCPWCARFSRGRAPRRFKTERGMRQHLRQCGANPNLWDLDRWIHTFNDDLRIVGGFQPAAVAHMNHVRGLLGGPHVDPDQARRLCVTVRDLALAGRLPATRDQLPGDTR
jgi:hypothetical protein